MVWYMTLNIYIYAIAYYSIQGATHQVSADLYIIRYQYGLIWNKMVAKVSPMSSRSTRARNISNYIGQVLSTEVGHLEAGSI